MTIQASVIGSPISHSLSPEIFHFLAKQTAGIDLHYRALDVTPANLKSCLQEFAADRAFIGTNVTVPHKESVMKIAHIVSPLAEAVGAANVLHLKDGLWTAHNTDVFGVSESLRDAGFRAYQSRTLVIGAGGAARAAVVALAREGGGDIHIYNRTHSRAQSLAHEMTSRFPKSNFFAVSEIHGASNESYDLLVQSTTLGMQGIPGDAASEFAPILDRVDGRPLAFDLVYRPADTVFLQLARRRGLPCLGGVNMLAHQALATWKIWFQNFPLPNDVVPRLISELEQILKRGVIPQ